MAAANGIIHTGFSVAAPPSAAAKTMLAGETSLSRSRAAVAADLVTRWDSRFDSDELWVANMTILAQMTQRSRPYFRNGVCTLVLAATGNTTIAATQTNAAVALDLPSSHSGVFTEHCRHQAYGVL